MIKRIEGSINVLKLKRRTVALVLAAASPLALAAGPADAIVSDGDMGGAFWSQAIDTSSARSAPFERFAVGPEVVIPSDGQPGGSFWGAPDAGERFVAASEKTFTGTAHTSVDRPYSYLEDYNP